MKKVLKILGKMLIAFGIILGILFIGAFLFIEFSPQFGATLSKEQKALFAKNSNYEAGTFINNGDVKMKTNFTSTMKMINEFLKPHPNIRPSLNVDVVSVDATQLESYRGPTRIIWFGHSTLLLQIDGKNVLLDPMFSKVAAPHPWLGQKRFSNTLPITIAQLPVIDLVLYSHDHYDHLDYESVKLLKDKVNMFYTPLGVGAHLKEWGVKTDKIVEMNWWAAQSVSGLDVICTPAQHFSGRGLTDRGQTLWGGWVIKNKNENLFFSGDSGYGAHFKRIGEKYGPFDFAMMECGQYNALWKEIHMMPEETVEAGIDLKAKKIMPIHWGAFSLSTHPWTEPVERLMVKSEALKMPIVIPKIGAPILVLDDNTVLEPWWQQFN